MECDNRRVVPRRYFESAASDKDLRVAASDQEFGEALCGDRAQQQNGKRHAAVFNETQLAVKPGPNAVSRVRGGRPD